MVSCIESGIRYQICIFLRCRDLCVVAGYAYADAQLKPEELVMDGKDIQKDLQRKLRGHPLFFGITMGLLAEIINSR